MEDPFQLRLGDILDPKREKLLHPCLLAVELLAGGSFFALVWMRASMQRKDPPKREKAS